MQFVCGERNVFCNGVWNYESTEWCSCCFLGCVEIMGIMLCCSDCILFCLTAVHDFVSLVGTDL